MKYIKRKMISKPLTGQIINTLNIEDEYNNAPSINLVKHLIKDIMYPIGSYYWSENNIDPSDLFGGTWERIKDRFLYALGDTGTINETGGSSTHSHTQSATTGGTALTVAQMPSHDHMSYITGWSGWGNLTVTGYVHKFENVANQSSGTTSLANTSTARMTLAAGNGQAHNHTLSATNSSNSLPPYIKAYCWKRIA